LSHLPYLFSGPCARSVAVVEGDSYKLGDLTVTKKLKVHLANGNRRITHLNAVSNSKPDQVGVA